MEVREKDAEDLCFTKRARQLRQLGGHNALLSLKLGGSSLTPDCLHSNLYLLDRLVAFICHPFWWSSVFTATWLLVFDWFLAKLSLEPAIAVLIAGRSWKVSLLLAIYWPDIWFIVRFVFLSFWTFTTWAEQWEYMVQSALLLQTSPGGVPWKATDDLVTKRTKTIHAKCVSPCICS